ncbi:cyclic nucleotide-binding domain protein (macronuclear) [Tetrahymena thermophila SB210]|uniref:Cyclic nucleotide-binding domain protein n=1 Tax=Tetrahymena thermophila (strain SB210) TaxID=312017 RepID=Q22Y13_TETTS|nr:cyclic nucleotide-binding domain protein [Tetrahymena thermophila SB210]EAR90211.1 cyclic nucleotide-binding domain protein [Tetrahymena thermophila SB210]|eukprot:XP_001010456.1 cyclic nucleotide-binding domain protein [Tetrahymena thermophila SB210]
MQEEQKRAQALKENLEQINQQSAAINSNKLFNVEVKQVGQAMLKRKADGYVDKQREKENTQIQQKQQSNDLNFKSGSGVNNNDKSKADDYKTNQKDLMHKEKLKELSIIQQKQAKKQAREFKELKMISGLATVGEKKTVQGDGNQDIQKIVVKSAQAIVLMLKGETFKQLFSDMIESEEKINSISFFLSIPLFSNFRMREINQILQKTKIQVYKKSQIVFNENDIAENLYIVKKGEFAVQKEIQIKSHQMPDLYNKKIIKHIEICSLTEGQYFGLDELLENHLANNQISSNPNSNIIKRVNSVKCLQAESELFIIPYDQFKKYINSETVVIDNDSLQNQANIRNEILAKKKLEQEKQEMRVLAIKKNIKKEQQKYHQIQNDEINIQQKEKNQTYYKKLLHDSSSEMSIPFLNNQSISLQTALMKKQTSFCIHQKDENSNHPNQLFITSDGQNQKHSQYILDKQQNLNNKAIQLGQVDQIKNNFEQFNKNISIYNDNMQKYIKAVTDFSDRVTIEQSEKKNHLIIKNQNANVQHSNSLTPKRGQSKLLIHQLNYQLTNPQQSRYKRSYTSNSNHKDRDQTPEHISANVHDVNSIQQISPKNQIIKLQQVESINDAKSNSLNGVKKVNRLFNYLSEIECKQNQRQQTNSQIICETKEKQMQNIDNQQIGKYNQQQKKLNNKSKQLQAISSYQKLNSEENNQFIEDLDEIEYGLNKKDKTIQILHQTNNNLNQQYSKNYNLRLSSINLQQQQEQKQVKEGFQNNYRLLNKSDGSINQHLTFRDLEEKYQTQQEKKVILQNNTFDKINTSIFRDNKQKVKQQGESASIEQLLDEINQNYSKVPVKPFIVSPSCAVKNTKRMIKKSRRGMQNVLGYIIEYQLDNQTSNFYLESKQLPQSSYNYKLNPPIKKMQDI